MRLTLLLALLTIALLGFVHTAFSPVPRSTVDPFAYAGPSYLIEPQSQLLEDTMAQEPIKSTTRPSRIDISIGLPTVEARIDAQGFVVVPIEALGKSLIKPVSVDPRMMKALPPADLLDMH